MHRLHPSRENLPANPAAPLSQRLGAVLSSVGERGGETPPDERRHKKDAGLLCTAANGGLHGGVGQIYGGRSAKRSVSPQKFHAVSHSPAGPHICSFPTVCAGTLFSPSQPHGQWLLFLGLACLIKELLLAESTG